ncbi:MAG: hypothetical protein K8R68_03480, partial [Bacteroidales bacterium]|nr:hypothetical protein [Bacteroidales bacterium]
MLKNNYKKYKQLRKDFVFFTFEGYFITDNPESLKIVYHFNLSDKFHFYPEIDIRKKSIINSLTSHQLESFVFHIGMIELISYWKAACPRKLIVKPFALNPEQITWWKKIYFNGLGEFFYINNIKNNIEDFIEIVSGSDKILTTTGFNVDNKNVIVPVGGGKDSVVTLELLKDKYGVIPIIINAREASLNTIKTAGFTDDGFVEINRTIHPQLLELNEKGFLNGHTPFSALIAFVSIMTAALTGSRYIALSNESSANEPTDKESGVNHQYSKSFEFEKDF